MINVKVAHIQNPLCLFSLRKPVILDFRVYVLVLHLSLILTEDLRFEIYAPCSLIY